MTDFLDDVSCEGLHSHFNHLTPQTSKSATIVHVKGTMQLPNFLRSITVIDWLESCTKMQWCLDLVVETPNQGLEIIRNI